jgi:hypothetical protein
LIEQVARLSIDLGGCWTNGVETRPFRRLAW